ncbi:MAG TPA: DUF58 domain-containing protein [Vicinamibacteria bacterium]|nr:DUF58 domain-containing protein [Vicinamibacteria bacterium]
MAHPRAGRWTRRSPLASFLLRFVRERLTTRGRYLLGATAALGLLGLDTLRSQVFLLFAAAAATLLVALAFALWPPPRARFECPLPARTTAGRSFTVRARVRSARGPLPDLHLSLRPRSEDEHSLVVRPAETLLAAGTEEATEVSLQIEARQRGRYVLQGPALRATDPLRLVTGRAARLPDQALIAYPRFWRMPEFAVPLGRRYQPGGIPLSSNVGDAVEFVGTRDYRPGDPLRSIHWRSWARRGAPVVKEYQEEYFCRIAIVVDTFLPKRPRPRDRRLFEAAISVAASVADFFSRTEHVVDVLAAGPILYEVSAGRSLAYLENILDVLACLEPCPEPPFRTIGPALFERLGQVTTVVAVMLDWDDARQGFLGQIRALGTAVRAVVVHEGATARPWEGVSDELGVVELMTPDSIERALAAEGGA